MSYIKPALTDNLDFSRSLVRCTCPGCGEPSRLLPIRRGGSYRLVGLTGLEPHGPECPDLIPRLHPNAARYHQDRK